MIEPKNSGTKISAFEGLRGAMAWWVVFGHISLTFGWRLPLIDQNHLAVDVFIMLSGFVIARLIIRKHETYGAYVTRRAFRIFPLYIFALVSSALLLPVQMQAWASLADETAVNANRVELARIALANFPAHFAVHIPLVQGLIPNSVLPQSAYTIIGQAWSVSLEWQFYLLAPLLVWSLLSRDRLPIVVGLGVLLWFASRYFSDAFIGSKLLLFFVGICSYLAVENTAKQRVWVATTLAVSFLAIIDDGPIQAVSLLIWAMVLMSVFAWRNSRASILAAVLSSKPAVHFGEISYSIYLVHMMPLYGSIFLLRHAGVSGLALELTATAAAIIASYCLARMTYLFIEKPGIDLGARLTRPSARSPIKAQE